MLELLAPAGSMESVQAAVQHGAGAVYLGYGDFNARRNAKNFTREEAAAAVSYCHLRDTKVHLTLNTLLTDRELPKAAQVAAEISEMGVDAVIVQDLGVARMLRQVAPDVHLHASTQMTVHSLDGVKECADLGMTRAVLSRELSRDQIAYICQNSPIEIEVFGHGALCMCYSGQCYLSSMIGGRSGNRGLCAQPCRLKYGWGKRADEYPLSLKDMSLVGYLKELEDMGVACLKLEGRMKRPEYVAIVTRVYADALREGREPWRRSCGSWRPLSPARASPRATSWTRRDPTCSVPARRGRTPESSLPRPEPPMRAGRTARPPCGCTPGFRRGSQPRWRRRTPRDGWSRWRARCPRRR